MLRNQGEGQTKTCGRRWEVIEGGGKDVDGKKKPCCSPISFPSWVTRSAKVGHSSGSTSGLVHSREGEGFLQSWGGRLHLHLRVLFADETL